MAVRDIPAAVKPRWMVEHGELAGLLPDELFDQLMKDEEGPPENGDCVALAVQALLYPKQPQSQR